MAIVIDHGNDSVHLTATAENIWLSIGSEPKGPFKVMDRRREEQRHVLRGGLKSKIKSRHATLTPSQARKLAIALLIEAERLELTT
jgi:hypothetical protein